MFIYFRILDLKCPQNICEAKSTIESTVQNRGLDLLVNIVGSTDVENLSSVSDKMEMYFLTVTLIPLSLFKVTF